MNNRGYQNSIFKSPIPLLIGNVSLKSATSGEYFYLSSYFVDDNNLLYYDNFSESWLINEVNLPEDLFPVVSGGNFYFKMNGFVNVNGYPSFTYSDLKLYFNDVINNWCISTNEINPLYSKQIFPEIYHDNNESSYGNAIEDFSSYTISSFQVNTPYINYFDKIYVLSGDSLQNTVVFSDDESAFSGKVLPPQSNYKNCLSKLNSSPTIISGDNCLGYYNDSTLGVPYIIGNFVVGNNSIKIIGSSNQEDWIYFRGDYPAVFDRYKHDSEQSYDDGCALIGKSLDKKYQLFQIYIEVSPPSGSADPFEFNNYVLVSGGLDTPYSAKQIWYFKPTNNDYRFFTYQFFQKNNVVFHGYPDSNNISVDIIGLTNINYNKVSKINRYIGNWIAPQTTFNGE